MVCNPGDAHIIKTWKGLWNSQLTAMWYAGVMVCCCSGMLV